MAFIGIFETPSTRLARLRTQLDSTSQSMGDTVTDAVDLEARRRAMEDSLRQFRAETGITREMRAQRERDVRAVRPTPAFFPEAPRGAGDIRFGTAPTGPLTAEGISLEEAQGLRQLGLQTGNRTIGISPEGETVLPSETQPVALERAEQFRTRFTAPIAAAALQVAESPAGAGIPGIRELRELQAEAGPTGRALGGADIGVPGVREAVEAAGFAAEAAGATFPRQRTFGEVFESGAVNPIAAALGSEEEQRKAQAVLEEAGLARSLAVELVFDPFNLVPVIGFTKVDDFARLLRTAVSATGRGRQAAVTTLRNSETVQAALRGIREAPEAGARPLRGGETLAQLEDVRAGFTPRQAADDALRGFDPPRFDVDVDTHIAKADPSGTPPRRPPPVAGGASPDDPQFDAILDAAITGEKPDLALMRRHQGVIDARTSQLAVEATENNKELVKIGLGRSFRGSVVAKTEGSFDELNSLLHNPSAVARGERIVPDELRPIYAKLRAQTDWEQAARIDFDPDMALVEDYFFRGWRPPEGMLTGEVRGALGRNPQFKLPRVDATYDEMIEAGFKPLFENPARQAEHSQKMGMKYREQSRLIDKMRAVELALPVKGGPIPEGWRVPKVGPAFEGKPYAAGARVEFTRQWAVTDSMANRLENIYGKTPRLGKGEIFGKTVDFQKVADAMTFIPKRAKLVGSVFQHLDFLQRSGSGAFSGFADALRRGQPIDAVIHLAKWPKSAVDIVHSTFSPGARARLAKLGVDPAPLWKDRQISNLMLREEGLSLRDPTLGIDLDDVIRQVKAEPRIVRLGKSPIRALDALERQWRQGLFQGTYPAAILSDVKNNIGPMLLRQHPEATDRQLAGMISEAANKLYSVIPESQSVIQNKQARWFLTRFLFSLGENEGLLRSFTGAIRGPNAALFRTRLLGTYLGLMTLASTIHFASTGKPLPLDRFVPVSKDKFGPLPFGYNTDFASPTLPIKGRGGVDIELDLVMQQDTIFRILDPKSFLNARFSVPVSTLRNQAAGTDFFGAPIDTVGPGGIFSRTSQLVQDLFAPIGAGQAGLEIFRNNVEESEGLITPGEGRLGTAGLGIQAGGVNLRAERTPELLDRIRAEVLRDRGIEESYGEIATTDLPLKAEIDIDVEERIGAELEVRGETSRLRGQQTPQSEGFEALEATRERQQVEQLADDDNLSSGRWAGDVWRKNYADRQREFFASREQIKEDFQITFDDREAPSGSVNTAIDAYFEVNVDNFNLPDGTVDWDAFFDARDAALAPLSSTDRGRVVTWLRKFDTPTVAEFRKAKDVVDRFFETPKYKGLSLEDGQEVDRILNEVIPRIQTTALRQGIELERSDAIAELVPQIVDDKDVEQFLLDNFGPQLTLGRRRRTRRRRRTLSFDVDVTNEERDRILLDNQELLARFYPDLLQRQLNREQEAGLGEEAFAAVQR